MKNKEDHLAEQDDTIDEVEIAWGVKVPVRDGVELNATVYKPVDMKEPLPVIFGFTPYISDVYHPRGVFFAKNGYITAVVDIRGRGNSGGDFIPVAGDDQDGHDVVEWLASQDFCNGKVTMMGGSYGGFVQWAALKNSPKGLSTIVPTAAGYPSHDFPFYGNIFYSYFIQWLTFVSGKAANTNLFSDMDFWVSKFKKMYVKHLPFKELDKLAGNMSTVFQMWLKNSFQNEYWDEVLPAPEDYAKIDIPILTITGHFDGDQNGAMDFYREHMKYGNEKAKQEHYLIIGPWDHGGTATPQKSIGGLTFDDASVLDMMKLHKEWYDWRMKDGEKPEFLKKRVAYYVMETEEWKYADSLEDIPSKQVKYYLSSVDGKPNDVFQSGSLSVEEPDPGIDEYVYDPLDVRPGLAELKNIKTDEYRNQTHALNLYGGGLVYHTKPFEKDVEITGYPKLTAWIEMDVKDTDFMVNLTEIKPNGESIQLSHEMLRARFKDSCREEKLIQPGKIEKFEFDWFFFFSRKITKGSRLRLVLSAVNTPMFEKNYNTGGNLKEDSGKDAITAHIKLYHNEQYKTVLELPMVEI